MNKQIVLSPQGERMVMMPEVEYEELLDAIDDARDAIQAQAIMARVATGEEETFPSAFVDRLFGEDNRVRVWREYREMSLTQLASEAKLLDEELAEIETDQRSPTVEELRAIARALRVSMDDLVR